MEPTKNNGATDVAAPTAPRTEPNKASVPENGDGRKCQMPGCENLATDGGIDCVQHQPASWQERLAAFPAELRDKDIWCVWRPEERDSKLTKVPCAKSNDPATWVSFEEACAIADKTQGYGVGVFCDGNHTFVDLDKCIVDGQIEPWAQAVLMRAGSYAELSPSGTGLHIFLKGAVSKAAKINGCEIYSKARFFTVTGQHIPTTPLTIAEPTAEELEELRQDIADGVLRPKAAVAEDGRVGRLIVADRYMTQAEREAKLERALALDLNDYNGDRSAAVYGALQLLARKHGGDEEAMLEEFEASPLCADWGSKWERLKENEIAKAVTNWKDNGSPAWGDSDELEDKLAAMNEKYCYVDESDVVVRLRGMRMYDAYRFCNGGHLANYFHVTAGEYGRDGKRKVKKERMAKLWLEWPERRQVERIVYEPGRAAFYEGSINRWQGMGVEPNAGSVAPWTELLERLITDEKARKWFEQWCAYPLQNLGAKLKSAVIIWGVRQGTGKTTLANTIMRIYGRNAAAITETHLHAPFNEWALDKQFICADEITAGDKRSTADSLKEWIAGHETIRINQKFQPEIVIRNCINFLFTSNHPNSFYLETTDRRYLVVEVPDTEIERQFFDSYYKWLDNGGPAALYRHLLNLPLADFNPHGAPPMTEGKEAMIDLGLSDLDRWLQAQRQEKPDLMQTAEEFLTAFTARHMHAQVKTAGMSAALRRTGAVAKPVKVGGKVLRLWCLEPTWRERPPHVWAGHYDTRRQTPPAARAEATVSDAEVPF